MGPLHTARAIVPQRCTMWTHFGLPAHGDSTVTPTGDDEDRADSDVETPREPERDQAPTLDTVRLYSLLDSIAGYRDGSVISTLRSIEDGLWKRFHETTPDFGGGIQAGVRFVAWCWVVQAFRQAHAVATLYEGGMADSSPANARAAMEHGIYLSVLADHAEPSAVVNVLEHSYLRFFDEIVARDDFPGALRDPLVELRDELPTTQPRRTQWWLAKVKQICDHLTCGEEVYIHYRALSAQVHPGFAATTPVIQGLIRNGRRQELPIELGTVTPMPLWIAIGSAGWAGWSYDRLFDSDHFTDLLAERVHPLGFHPLRLVDRNAPPLDDE